MKTSIRRKLAHSKRRIQRRLDKRDLRGCSQPMMTARNIHYEIAGRSHGMPAAASDSFTPSLADSVSRRPSTNAWSSENPPALSRIGPCARLAYLPLCGGTCLQDLELLRHDEVLLDALGRVAFPTPPRPGTSVAAFPRTAFRR